MLTLTPIAAANAPITRLNPLAKLAAAMLVSVTAMIATDWFTPSLLLVIELAVLPLTGVNLGRFLHRVRFIWFAAFTVGVVNTLFAAEDLGAVLLDFGPFHITSSNIETGISLALRVLAIAIPGVLAFASTDPTELADSLIQQLNVSSRFAIGALAAFRLLPLLAIEWQMITMARRARGVDAGWNPAARIRLFASTMFALLVGAVRRGTRLATAMDARGFDSGVARTVARPQRMHVTDWFLIAATTAACGVVLATSIGLGRFELLF